MESVRAGMTPTLTVAATSLASEMDNVAANLKKAMEIIARAADKGAEIIAFPEAYLVGIGTGSVEGKFFELAEPIPGPSTTALVEQAIKHNIYVIIGLIEANQEYPGIIHNSAAFLGPEGIIGVYRKTHIHTCPHILKGFDLGLFPGDEAPVFKIRQNWNIGISICFDTFIPELPRAMAIKGMDLLITIAAGPDAYTDTWYMLNSTRAMENTVFHVFSNSVGPQWGNVTFFGGPMIIAPDGTFSAKGKVGEEDLIMAKLQVKDLFEARRFLPTLRNRRPSAYGDLLSTKYPHI